MRKGMDGLALLVQQVLNEDPFGGALFAFRGAAAGSSSFSGMTARVCAFTPSGWNAATSSGRSPTPAACL
jgi:hypothetical protein